MARQRKLTEERKKIISQLLSTYQSEDVGDVQSMLKGLLGVLCRGYLKSNWKMTLVIPNMIMSTNQPTIGVMGTARKQLPYPWET